MKVWSKSQFANIDLQNNKFLNRLITDDNEPKSQIRIAIIGGGPKGSYALERLASVWSENFPTRALDIFCFNDNRHFGAGPNYQTDQPDYLLMNYPLGKIDFWTDEPEQLVQDRPDLAEFITRFKGQKNEPVFSADYCSRALTGVYLQYCFRRVVNALPTSIHLHLKPEKVTAIVGDSNNLTIRTENGSYGAFSEVLCCTGHAYSFPKTDSYLAGQKKTVKEPLVIAPYPIRELERLQLTGKNILVKGLGLTFVDTVLAMTEGRDGVFQRKKDRLSYIPSGKEPNKIVAYSRTGLPMIARQTNEGQKFPLKFFTEEWVNQLAASSGKISFQQTLLPMIEREYRYRYAFHFCSLMRNRQLDLSEDLEQIESRLQSVYPEFHPFDLESFLSPLTPTEDLHSWVMNYIEMTVFPESQVATQRAKVATSTLWRELYPIFNKLYSFGKLTGKSQQLFDTAYFSRFQRVSYGPPKLNMEKILALAASGLLRFDVAANPTVTFGENRERIKVTSPALKGSLFSEILVDARIARPADIFTQPEYIQRLASDAGVDFFCNEDHVTGSLELDELGRLKNHNRIAFYGTPTEGWTLDNESLSRSNNNFLSPWAQQLVQHYAKHHTAEVNTYCPSMDQGDYK
ncbi:FAD/NAD(P)-binding protein [Pleomorphovibrio marinus]|uniref:FAD/NAD(P)-binding protein n=1 Tax=Pleomorphovibrio marinus TaxID=2164132 RepID=UPI000E0C933C|nr:FAD/NAD(P)-binding domain-containing protein [Pleomorphovibrio marinus]